MDNSFFDPTSESSAHLADFFCFKGRPINLDGEHDVRILMNQGYIAGFSSFRKQAVWTAYRVANARDDVDYERPHLFYEDKRLPPEDHVTTWSFGKVDGVSYDRGHLVPNSAINTQFGRLAQMETFFMSNISPQARETNRGVWHTLEKRILREYATSLDHIWVYAGPIFGENPQVITRSNGSEIHIPESFYCILVDPLRWPHDQARNVRFLALEIPQDAGYTSLDEDLFSVSIESIEERTKINFFPDLTAKEVKDVEETPWGSWQEPIV